MNRYANPWSGSGQFYKGKPTKLPTAETDKDYQAYCNRKKNKSKILHYMKWARQERIKHGMF
jgi:hypothetical protein